MKDKPRFATRIRPIFSDLRAIYVNCTLQHPDKSSHIVLLMGASVKIMRLNERLEDFLEPAEAFRLKKILRMTVTRRKSIIYGALRWRFCWKMPVSTGTAASCTTWLDMNQSRLLMMC
jgi:hypothetical protein